MQKFTLLLATMVSANALALDVKLADSAWDGQTIPADQRCQKFGGDHPATPKLAVSDIPAGSDSIVLVYSDRDSKKMNNGGHGVMEFALPENSTTVEIPTVPGHSYELPEGFKMIAEHRGKGWDKEGAYMPPCSGGKGHQYYVTVQTWQGNTVTAETVLEWGKF